MKKFLSAVVISSSFFFSGICLADNSTDVLSNSTSTDSFRRGGPGERYICKDADRTIFVRILMGQSMAYMRRISGGVARNYDLPCTPGTGDNWLVCEETAGRTLEFKVGGASAVYHGSVKDTYLDCFRAD